MRYPTGNCGRETLSPPKPSSRLRALTGRMFICGYTSPAPPLRWGAVLSRARRTPRRPVKWSAGRGRRIGRDGQLGDPHPGPAPAALCAGARSQLGAGTHRALPGLHGVCDRDIPHGRLVRDQRAERRLVAATDRCRHQGLGAGQSGGGDGGHDGRARRQRVTAPRPAGSGRGGCALNRGGDGQRALPEPGQQLAGGLGRRQDGHHRDRRLPERALACAVPGPAAPAGPAGLASRASAPSQTRTLR